MLRVSIYLKSGAVADFEAEAVMEGTEGHPKFRLDFPGAENGTRRLVYIDRDDVSAVVVEDAGEGRRARVATEEAVISIPGIMVAPEEEDVMTVSHSASSHDAIAP